MSDEKVQREMKLLDEKCPGWRTKIKIDLLDMGSCKRCILGQIYGDFNNGSCQLRLQGTEEEENGFDYDDHSTYSELTAAWEHALK